MASEKGKTPDEIMVEYLYPGEQIIFTSAKPHIWTKVPYRPTKEKLKRAELMDAHHQLYRKASGWGLTPSTILAIGPRAPQYKGKEMEWLILTDQRLFLIDGGILAQTYELSPARVREWITAEREARTEASEQFREERQSKGLLRALVSDKSEGAGGISRPLPLHPIVGVKGRLHLFRRKNSFIGCLIPLAGAALVATLLIRGMPGIWAAILYVTILVFSKVRPWTGVRLRILPLDSRLPNLLRKLTGRVMSQSELQLSTAEETKKLIELIAPRAAEIDALIKTKI